MNLEQKSEKSQFVYQKSYFSLDGKQIRCYEIMNMPVRQSTNLLFCVFDEYEKIIRGIIELLKS